MINKKKIEISVVIPCLNEEKTIGECVNKAIQTLKKLNLVGEIIVVDNNSSDNSGNIAKRFGAKVILEKRRGYGSAYLRGLHEAQGKYLVIADGDGTYDFGVMGKFIKLLDQGFDFVNGSRLKGKIDKDAMPWLHRYIGVPFLTWLLNFLFHCKVSDAHCGMRAFTKEAYKRMDLRTLGMEFASEMIIKAGNLGLKIADLPINYYPRKGISKLNSFRDGWRHIRFMLFFSPDLLFIYPGIFCLLAGIVIIVLLLPGPVSFRAVQYDIHSLELGSLLSIFGFQLLNVGIFAKIFSFTEKFNNRDSFIKSFLSVFSLEKAIILGFLLAVAGFSFYIFAFLEWMSDEFKYLSEMRRIIVATTLIILGAQTIFSSFFMSLLLMSRKR